MDIQKKHGWEKLGMKTLPTRIHLNTGRIWVMIWERFWVHHMIMMELTKVQWSHPWSTDEEISDIYYLTRVEYLARKHASAENQRNEQLIGYLVVSWVRCWLANVDRKKGAFVRTGFAYSPFSARMILLKIWNSRIKLFAVDFYDNA